MPAVLWGPEPLFRRNGAALAWLEATQRRAALLTRRSAILPWDTVLTASDLTSRLAAGSTLAAQQHQQGGDALALAASQAQTELPMSSPLLTDAAAVYRLMVDQHDLWSSHDRRHAAHRTPLVAVHQERRSTFRSAEWGSYRQLLAGRAARTGVARDRLRAACAVRFSRRSGSQALSERIAKSWATRAVLLVVLAHPDRPLHDGELSHDARGIHRDDRWEDDKDALARLKGEFEW